MSRGPDAGVVRHMPGGGRRGRAAEGGRVFLELRGPADLRGQPVPDCGNGGSVRAGGVERVDRVEKSGAAPLRLGEGGGGRLGAAE